MPIQRQLPRLPDNARLEVATVVEIYFSLASSENNWVSPKEIVGQLKLGIGPGLLTRAIYEVARNTDLFVFDNEGDLRITDAGLNYIREQQESDNSPVNKYLREGKEWVLGKDDPIEANLDVTLEDATSATDKVTTVASPKDTEQDAWEPLPLDRENPALEKAADGLEKLAEDLEADNGYAANATDEKNFIVTAFRAGAKAFREQSAIYKMQFQTFVWEPLERIIERFGKNAKGVFALALRELIVEAVKHIAKYLFS